MTYNDTLLDPTLLEADVNDLDPVEDPILPGDEPLEADPDDVVVPAPAGDDEDEEEETLDEDDEEGL